MNTYQKHNSRASGWHSGNIMPCSAGHTWEGPEFASQGPLYKHMIIGVHIHAYDPGWLQL